MVSIHVFAWLCFRFFGHIEVFLWNPKRSPVSILNILNPWKRLLWECRAPFSWDVFPLTKSESSVSERSRSAGGLRAAWLGTGYQTAFSVHMNRIDLSSTQSSPSSDRLSRTLWKSKAVWKELKSSHEQDASRRGEIVCYLQINKSVFLLCKG